MEIQIDDPFDDKMSESALDEMFCELTNNGKEAKKTIEKQKWLAKRQQADLYGSDHRFRC